MTNAELIACIQAEEQGKKVECRSLYKPECGWNRHSQGCWDTTKFEYRIAREPRKCWVHWTDGGSALVADYDASKRSDAEWIANGWQLVEEVIK